MSKGKRRKNWWVLHSSFCPRLLKIYNKIHKFTDVLSHFSITEWKITNERLNELTSKLTTEDRKLFLCDMKELVWDTYFQNYLRGIRIYILKDPIETIPQARIRWQRYFFFPSSSTSMFIVLLSLTIPFERYTDFLIFQGFTGCTKRWNSLSPASLLSSHGLYFPEYS